MSVRILAATAVLASISSVAVFSAASFIWKKPLPDLDGRPVSDWSPVIVPLGDPNDQGKQDRSFPQTFARPMFNPTRRPFVPVAETPEPEPVPEPEPQSSPSNYDAKLFSLKGILITNAASRALIASPESPEGIWVSAGMEIMGWKVASVDQDSVKLEAKGQSAEIKLYVDNVPN